MALDGLRVLDPAPDIPHGDEALKIGGVAAPGIHRIRLRNIIGAFGDLAQPALHHRDALGKRAGAPNFLVFAQLRSLFTHLRRISDSQREIDCTGPWITDRQQALIMISHQPLPGEPATRL